MQKKKITSELEKFNIKRESAIKTIKQPDQILYDTQTNRYVAINHKEKTAIIYEKEEKHTLTINHNI